ncbi:MAG: DUF6125 family protein [Solidesulfovibrio sp.]|uniref:DUF6125 family protein n=1 Tax=Solidesulfovibrio sp. TaxID=2910990 RepID=UPI002B20ED00|nr:DUF6125 family protein [Solidesulfovibrio sp.]MEA4858478.1 DUF6125 family protein [Solidesulfovibrio sp.]
MKDASSPSSVQDAVAADRPAATEQVPIATALADQVVQAVRQIAVHYGLWLAEAAHQFGPEAAVAMEARVGEAYLPLLARRIERALGLPGAVPDVLAGLGRERLESLLDALSVSWLAADGVWFRQVEDDKGLHDAKRVNDTCWSRLGRLEAVWAKGALGLAEAGGLATLRAALGQRLVGRVNAWDIVEDGPDGFVLRMLRCRVQSSRTRQGLPPYPCLSGGTVEFTAFAAGIDPAIRVACVSCPPEVTRDDCACAWRFSLPVAGA